MRVPRLSLDLLRGFCAAARHLSFTRAAQELFVTQPAISREVRTLEEQIGKPLFRRVGRALELTEAGRELYRAVDEGLGLIDAATMRIAGAGRSLSVTTTVAFASTWLVPRLPRFTAAHPEIDMRLVATNDAVDLEREHVDFAIRFVHGPKATHAGEKLFDYLQFPVCAPALAADPSCPLRTADDLKRHVLLDFETVLYGRPWYDWDQWFGAMGVRRPRTSGWLRFSHYDQVIDAAQRGSGVAVGKLPHLSSHLEAGVLVAPLGPDGTVRVGAFHLEMAPTALSDVVEPFIDWLRAEASDNGSRGRETTPALRLPEPAAPDARKRRGR